MFGSEEEGRAEVDRFPKLRAWWPDTIANADFYRQTEVTCIIVIIKVKKRRWTGH